jgi:hypothetical protein
LVLIQSAEEKIRSFLFTAVGNSIGHIRPHQRIHGIDVRFPVHFSPVTGLCYLRENTDPETARVIVRQIWSHFRSNDHELLMLNGAVATTPEIWPEILAASRMRQIILAEAVFPELPKSARTRGRQATVLAASQDTSRPGTNKRTPVICDRGHLTSLVEIQHLCSSRTQSGVPDCAFAPHFVEGCCPMSPLYQSPPQELVVRG